MCTGLEVALISAAITTTAVVSTNLAQKGPPTPPTFPELPPIPTLQPTVLELPEPEKVKDSAREMALDRQRRRTRTILTNPAGIEDQANIGIKTLLGG